MSLPSRERGLKLNNPDMAIKAFTSLPSRERGLKLCSMDQQSNCYQSLPSRERGLKFNASGIITSVSGRSLRGSVD